MVARMLATVPEIVTISPLARKAMFQNVTEAHLGGIKDFF